MCTDKNKMYWTQDINVYCTCKDKEIPTFQNGRSEFLNNVPISALKNDQ